MSVNKLKKNIKAGQQGENIGVSMGLPNLDKVLYGVQRRYIYTIGADTSAGKTSFAIDIYLYNLLKNAEKDNIKVNVLYYSFEMATEVLYAKLLSRHIWDTYGEIITFEDILSLTKPISDEHIEIVNKGIDWLQKIEEFITIYDRPIPPLRIYGTLKEWLKKFGKFTSINENIEHYTENDKSEYKIALIDHVGLIPGPGSKKERIDTTVEYFIYFRNKCGLTGVFVQQLNRNMKAMDRKLNNYELVQLDDFKDTSGTTDGSEVVIALYYPYREKIPKVDGHPIQHVLKSRYRLIQVLKNRYGRSDVNQSVTFHGEIGMFKELPRAEDIDNYDKYINLDYIENEIEDEEEQKDEKITKNIEFTL